MFRHKDPGARYFPANRRPLQDPHQQQQYRGNNSHRCIGRQQADSQGRNGHQQNAEGEHLFASHQVAEVGHHDAAQRTRQIPGGKNAKGLHLTQPFRDISREEQRPDDSREKDENNEVIKLQRAAESGKREGFIILTIERPVVM